MLQIGKFNKLKVVKTVDFGVYLDGGEKGEILLPRKFVPEQSCSEGGEIDVFVYYDSEDRLIATTQKPYAQVGEFAWLQVKSVNRIAAKRRMGAGRVIRRPFCICNPLWRGFRPPGRGGRPG